MERLIDTTFCIVVYRRYKTKRPRLIPACGTKRGALNQTPQFSVSPNHQGYSPILKPAYLTPVYVH